MVFNEEWTFKLWNNRWLEYIAWLGQPVKLAFVRTKSKISRVPDMMAKPDHL